jgi:hypothetical protein
MGIELVEGQDLIVENGVVRMRTTDGFDRVDVIIRCGLHEYIDQFQTKLNQAAEAIHERFFAFKLPPATSENATVGTLSNT